MLGAIMGDIVGSRFEFDRGDKTKEFELFAADSVYTDDTIMTVAVADALLEAGAGANQPGIKIPLIKKMKEWGKKYPKAGYGIRFGKWLFGRDDEPYWSFGNGSAMRVSPVGWLYDSLEKTREVARWTAEVTHNHPEGVKGAESVASVIFLSRNGMEKEGIRRYIEREFGYDLSRTCDEIRPSYHHVESCQKTVPEAITAFIEGESFIDVVRTAVSLGGDCDTLTDIAAAMAEAYYGIPREYADKVKKMLPGDVARVVDSFTEARQKVIAVQSDWATEDMGDKHMSFVLERDFTDSEMSALRRGHIPEAMEDKWFFYMRQSRLYIHRSWTGFMAYLVEFHPETGRHNVQLNVDPEKGADINEYRDNLNRLLDWWVRDNYDYYAEFVDETYRNLTRSGVLPEKVSGVDGQSE